MGATHDDANDREHPCFDLVATYPGVTVDGEPARQQAHHCATFFEDGDDGAVDGRPDACRPQRARLRHLSLADRHRVAMPPLSTLQAEAWAWLARFTFTD